eukprot:CAMPEP_0180813140 /NCGR_PEP_ID=MMETSP1038_2-20121128/66381_1 /TAXON_ID=632150 /ORGANISM="Azadinium spinosum, Strain 3D9" /LENGTH=78 /DNA_ID=CAMNT_0022854721 /DNA_START=54 /DNA_END=290 /DNA_ORIENTATION=-
MAFILHLVLLLKVEGRQVSVQRGQCAVAFRPELSASPNGPLRAKFGNQGLQDQREALAEKTGAGGCEVHTVFLPQARC